MTSPDTQPGKGIRPIYINGLKGIMERKKLTLDEAYEFCRKNIIERDPAALTTEVEENLNPLTRAYEFLKSQTSQ